MKPVPVLAAVLALLLAVTGFAGFKDAVAAGDRGFAGRNIERTVRIARNRTCGTCAHGRFTSGVVEG